jgi:hypothetical protein
MALLKAARTAQYPLVAEFNFSFNDTMVDVNGVTKTFGSVYTDNGTFEVIPLPPGAILAGGELIVETAGAGGGGAAYTCSVGNSASATAFLAATALNAAGRTALTAANLGYNANANGGGNIRITIAATTANVTAGKVRVRVMYTVDRKANETQIA